MVYNTENGASLQFRNQPTRKKVEEKDSGYCCWELRKKKEILFRNYLSRFARALSTIRAGRAKAVEVEMFMRKLPRTRHIWKSEILVPYLNNPSEETIFGSNKIKEQRNNETSK